jgi:hypothetical protein
MASVVLLPPSPLLLLLLLLLLFGLLLLASTNSSEIGVGANVAARDFGADFDADIALVDVVDVDVDAAATSSVVAKTTGVFPTGCECRKPEMIAASRLLDRSRFDTGAVEPINIDETLDASRVSARGASPSPSPSPSRS